MTGHASISTEVLARYAADAARDVPGVAALAESHLHRHRPVRVAAEDDAVRIEVHVQVQGGVSIPAVGRAVQQRVRDYLGRMADVELAGVDVVVDGVTG